MTLLRQWAKIKSTRTAPKNFKDAMRRTDRQEWAEAYDKEFQGFKEHGTLKAVRPVPGVKILGTTTRTEYKVVNSEHKKRLMRNGKPAE